MVMKTMGVEVVMEAMVARQMDQKKAMGARQQRRKRPSLRAVLAWDADPRVKEAKTVTFQSIRSRLTEYLQATPQRDSSKFTTNQRMRRLKRKDFEPG